MPFICFKIINRSRVISKMQDPFVKTNQPDVEPVGGEHFWTYDQFLRPYHPNNAKAQSSFNDVDFLLSFILETNEGFRKI